MTPDRIRALRARLGNLSQVEFARLLRVSPRNLQGWEIGRPITPTAETLLLLLEANPEIVTALLGRLAPAKQRSA